MSAAPEGDNKSARPAMPSRGVVPTFWAASRMLCQLELGGTTWVVRASVVIGLDVPVVVPALELVPATQALIDSERLMDAVKRGPAEEGEQPERVLAWCLLEGDKKTMRATWGMRVTPGEQLTGAPGMARAAGIHRPQLWR